MIKTLERHHREFYNWTRSTTSFFPGNPSIDEIFLIAQQVLNQNIAIIQGLPPSGRWNELRGSVDGIEYIVGVTNGLITTVYPPEQPGICTIQ